MTLRPPHRLSSHPRRACAGSGAILQSPWCNSNKLISNYVWPLQRTPSGIHYRGKRYAVRCRGSGCWRRRPSDYNLYHGHQCNARHSSAGTVGLRNPLGPHICEHQSAAASPPQWKRINTNLFAAFHTRWARMHLTSGRSRSPVRLRERGRRAVLHDSDPVVSATVARPGSRLTVHIGAARLGRCLSGHPSHLSHKPSHKAGHNPQCQPQPLTHPRGTNLGILCEGFTLTYQLGQPEVGGAHAYAYTYAYVYCLACRHVLRPFVQRVRHWQTALSEYPQAFAVRASRVCRDRARRPATSRV